MAGPGLTSGSAVQGGAACMARARIPLAPGFVLGYHHPACIGLPRLQEDFTMPRRVAPAHRSILAPLALIALAACGPDVTLDAGEETPPHIRKTPPPPDAALITTGSEPIGLSAEALTEWRAARDRLLGARTTLALGTSRGESPELFGMIGDAAFDLDGNVLVIDAANYDVRIFGPDGSHLMSFGREGEGPMEFRQPPAQRRSALRWKTPRGDAHRDEDLCPGGGRVRIPGSDRGAGTAHVCVGRRAGVRPPCTTRAAATGCSTRWTWRATAPHRASGTDTSTSTGCSETSSLMAPSPVSTTPPPPEDPLRLQ